MAVNKEQRPIRRFKRYTEYKDTGVEWLGEVPAHWRVTKMWDIAQATSGGTPAKDTLRYWDGGIPWVSPKDMKRRFIDSSEDTVSQIAISETGLKLIPAPVVLIVVRGMILAHSFPVGITKVPVTINQDMKALRLRPDVDPQFLGYWLEGVAQELLAVLVEEAGHGTKVIRMDRWRVMPAEIPPQDEQQAITAFLDRETAKIDALAANNVRLIELLEEKRAALVDQAVTQGIDPSVLMRNSDVESLDGVPEHWEVKPFMRCVVEKSDYRGKTPEKVASGVVLVTDRNVKMGSIDYECSQEFVAQREYDEIMRRGLPKKGDIIFTTEAPLGNVALVDREDVALAQRIIRFRMNGKYLNSRYSLFSMISGYFQGQLKLLSTGSTAEGLKASKLTMLRVLVPPLEEQVVILDHLDRELPKIRILIDRIRDAMERLVEFRTTLIATAVTGKIDVRGEVA